MFAKRRLDIYSSGNKNCKKKRGKEKNNCQLLVHFFIQLFSLLLLFGTGWLCGLQSKQSDRQSVRGIHL